MAGQILEALIRMRHVVYRRQRQTSPLEHVDLQRRDSGLIQCIGIERSAPIEAGRAVDDHNRWQTVAVKQCEKRVTPIHSEVAST